MMNKKPLSIAYCKVSGLSMVWAEGELGRGVEVEVEMHPIWSKGNFTKVESRVMDRKACWELDRELIAGICIYRLVKWGVVDRVPEGKVLNKWVREMAGEMDQGELRGLYRDVVANHSPEMERIERFKFRMEEIGNVRELVGLIRKCRDKQMGVVRDIAIERAKTEEEAARIAQEDKEERVIRASSTGELDKRVKRILVKYQKDVCNGDKVKEKKWRYVRGLFDGGIGTLEEGIRERVMELVLGKVGEFGSREERIIVREYFVRVELSIGDADDMWGMEE